MILNKLKNTRIFKFLERKHDLRSLRKVSKGLLQSEQRALLRFQDKLKKANIKVDGFTIELNELFRRSQLTTKQQRKINILLNDLTDIERTIKKNKEGIKFLKRVGKASQLTKLSNKIRIKVSKFKLRLRKKKSIKIKKIPKIKKLKEVIDVEVKQIELTKLTTQQRLTQGLELRKKINAEKALKKAKQLANANKAGVTTKAGLVKPRTLTEKEVKTFTNNLISAGTFSTQKVYTTTFRAYSLAFPVGSRAGLNQVFNISQKAEGKLSVVLANPVIQRRLIKQARKLRVKLKLRVKPKIKVRIKVKLKPKLRVAPKLKPKLKPKVRVKIKAKVKVKPKIKPKLKPKIKITPRITPIIIPIRIIQPNIPKIPLILGRFRRKKKPLRKVKRKLIKSRKITPKPTRRVSTAVLKRKALLKKDKEVKDGKKKKRKKKDFKVRNLKKRKSRKKIRSKK